MPEQSCSSPQFPPKLPHSLPASLSSLPTEVLVLILNNIPYHPSKHRFASLAKICLVNKFFLSITRPLLYHDISIDLEQTYDDQDSEYYKLVRTLTTNATRAKLVKEMRVSFFVGRTTRLDMVAFAYMLTQLHHLESVRASSWHERSGPLPNVFVESILIHQKGLKHLEIPTVTLDYDTFALIFITLGSLESFVGELVPPPRSKEEELFKPNCKLRRLVVTSPVVLPLQLFQILASSHASLTSLAFEISTSGNPFDLSSFPNLAQLRLVLAQDPLREHLVVPPGTDQESLSSALRPTLTSLRELPLKTLSISTKSRSIAIDFRSSHTLDALPRSIVHISLPFLTLEQDYPNSTLLTNRILEGTYRHLKHISILPTYNHLAWVGQTRQNVRAGLERVLKGFGVRVEVVKEPARRPKELRAIQTRIHQTPRIRAAQAIPVIPAILAIPAIQIMTSILGRLPSLLQHLLEYRRPRHRILHSRTFLKKLRKAREQTANPGRRYTRIFTSTEDMRWTRTKGKGKVKEFGEPRKRIGTSAQLLSLSA
ncbi:hypothetical protein JCM5353_008115 [Sporobolomyces roseus]